MDRILKTYHQATEQQISEGMAWYKSAQEFALSLNPDLTKSAGVIAALSPRQQWETNKKGAEKILRAANNLSSVVPSVAGTYSNVDKAWRIANGEDPRIVLLSCNPNRYYKVRRFFENILGNQELVTIDTWTAMVALEKAPPFVGGKQYLEIEKRFQKIAEKIGIPPRELQAICWLVVRTNGK